jgi:DeoR family transcriptional regulator, glycerol-3-phosphate regulon repressor
VADYEKFGSQALVRLAHASQIDRLFTDAKPPEGLARVLREAKVQVVVAS